MKVRIEKMDNQGRGIVYVDNLITFIPKTIIGDLVEIEIVKKSKKYHEARAINYLERGPLYKECNCPYYDKCGGCDLLNLSYLDQTNYKLKRVKELFLKYANELVEPVFISANQFEYRNKVTLTIKNGKVGLIGLDNEVIGIKRCLLLKPVISDFISSVDKFNINDGRVVIRANYNDELLIAIDTNDKIEIPAFNDFKIAGIILNDQVVKGDKSFIDKVNNLLFKVSYNSFFQVNSLINEELFKLINNYINNDDVVLDLYCGVGTLSINASLKAKEVIGIEIVKNAIIDANLNSRMNGRNNVNFLLGNVKDTINKVNKKFDCVIIDPPRNGIDNSSLEYILNQKINKIIYIACDTLSLVRDYEKIKDVYEIKHLTLLDMFPNTYHSESVCVLERK
ncbi:MAG: class I SAM-dependent RNA methyltransferase [Bacilli bacterium]|nr:class I SAM-dependent RNA methyltransferase [Bacilli bacterium]